MAKAAIGMVRKAVPKPGDPHLVASVDETPDLDRVVPAVVGLGVAAVDAPIVAAAVEVAGDLDREVDHGTGAAAAESRGRGLADLVGLDLARVRVDDPIRAHRLENPSQSWEASISLSILPL